MPESSLALRTFRPYILREQDRMTYEIAEDKLLRVSVQKNEKFGVVNNNKVLLKEFLANVIIIGNPGARIYVHFA